MSVGMLQGVDWGFTRPGVWVERQEHNSSLLLLLLLLPKSNVGEEKSDRLNRHSAMFSSRSMESAAELKGLWMGVNRHDRFFLLVSFGLSFFSFFASYYYILLGLGALWKFSVCFSCFIWGGSILVNITFLWALGLVVVRLLPRVICYIGVFEFSCSYRLEITCLHTHLSALVVCCWVVYTFLERMFVLVLLRLWLGGYESRTGQVWRGLA